MLQDPIVLGTLLAQNKKTVLDKVLSADSAVELVHSASGCERKRVPCVSTGYIFRNVKVDIDELGRRSYLSLGGGRLPHIPLFTLAVLANLHNGD